MKEATIIFPHQLFKNHPALKKGREIYLVEEWLYFNQFNFYQKKLMMHRASMKAYEAYLIKKGFEVVYIQAVEKRADIRILLSFLADQNVTGIHYTEVTDEWLQQRIENSCKKYQLKIQLYHTPNFLNSMVE